MNHVTKKIRQIVVAALVMVLITSCDPAKKFEKQEKESIQTYLNNNSDLNYELKPSGLYYLEVVAGTGASAQVHDTVSVMYRAKFLNGYEFDTNYDDKDTLKFAIGEGTMLQGFEEGLMFMYVGGKSKLLVPSFLGYGNYHPYMEPYTPILFEVELTKVTPGVGQ